MLSYVGDPERFHEVNERFHNAIYAGAHNGYLAEMTLATRVRVQPFRRAQFRNLGRLAKSHAEHDRVVVAIMRGDRPAPRPRCAPTSNWCARNTSFTRCRCRRASSRDAAAASRSDALRSRSIVRDPLAARYSLHASERVYTATFCAMNARQPPNAEMSRAPSIAAGFDQKALHAAAVRQPDRADRQRRRDRGDEFSEAAADSAQSSSLIDDPVAGLDAQHAGLWRRGRRAHRACSPARSTASSSRRPPSAVNSPFSAMPDRCAPTTAIAISSPLSCDEQRCERRLRQALGAQRQSGVGMEHAADAGELRVVSGGRQQRDAERNAVGRIAAGSASPQRSSRLTKLV